MCEMLTADTTCMPTPTCMPPPTAPSPVLQALTCLGAATAAAAVAAQALLRVQHQRLLVLLLLLQACLAAAGAVLRVARQGHSVLASEPAAAVLGAAGVQPCLGVVAAAASLALLPGTPQAAAGEAWHQVEASGHRPQVLVMQASALLHRWGPLVAIPAARGPGPCLAGVAGAAGWAQGRSGRA